MSKPIDYVKVKAAAERLGAKLARTAPTPDDWCLWCPKCEWVGERNAAYAASFLADHRAGCDEPLRIWRGAPFDPSHYEIVRLDVEVAKLKQELALVQAVTEQKTAEAIAKWLNDTRFDKPGREAEWSRFIAKQLVDGKWKPS